MMNNQDSARLFVLLSILKFSTGSQVRKNAQYLHQFFSDYTEDELCAEGQRQIKQLLDVDLQNKYGDVFRELSFEQRYSLCIEAPINFNGTNDLLRKWYEVYNNAKDKWFLAEEAYKIKEAVKASIDCIRDQARQKLLQENSLWADWESAKEQLYIESCWNVQNRKGNVLYQTTNHMAGHHYVFLQTADLQHMHYITAEDCLNWGKDASIIWAEGVTNGRFLRHDDGTINPAPFKGQIDIQLMPDALKNLPESKWDEQVYKYDQELKKWVQQMLGLCAIEDNITDDEVISSTDVPLPVIGVGTVTAYNVTTHCESSPKKNAPVETSVDAKQPDPNVLDKAVAFFDATHTSSEPEKATVTTSKITAKPKRVKNIATIQRELRTEWQAFIEVLSDVYTASSITSQDGTVYPITCNVRNRKATAKRNLKPIATNIANIEALLNEYKESYLTITSIDTAFTALCSISHEIQTLTTHIELLMNVYGYKYETSSDTANILSACITHYVTLLAASVRKILRPTEKLVNTNKKLTKQIKNRAQKIEACRSDIAASRKSLEDSHCSLQTMEESCKIEATKLHSEIEALEAALSTLTASISNTEAARLTNETTLSTTQRELCDLQARQQALQSEYDLWIDEDNRTLVDLQGQLCEAKAILQKTLLFKKNKQQRVDELESALTRHQENTRKQKVRFDTEIIGLRNACSALNAHIGELTTIVNDAKRTVAQLNEERTQLLHTQEAKNKALLKLQHDLTAAHNAVETNQEELKKQESVLATIMQEQTQSTTELEHNQSVLASLGDTLLQRIMVYPNSYSQAIPYISAGAISDLAFCKQLATQFTNASGYDAEILLLTNKHMHLSALYQAFQNLKTEGLINANTDFSPVLDEIAAIDENLVTLKEEVAYCFTPFMLMDATSVVGGTSAAFVKKANRLFETLWNHLADGSVPHSTLIRLLQATKCIQVSENNYLCFTPFYVIGIELKKNKPMTMELLRYTDFSFEAEETQVSLPYEAECPAGATVVAEHWKYETVTGAANRRYTNNPTYLVVALNAVKLVCNKSVKTRYLLSFEEAQRLVQAFCDLRNFLHDENADLMNRVFANDQIPNVNKIALGVAEERKKVERERKEQERRLKEQELALKKQREEEKRQKEEHQKRLEQWADSALRSKAEDDLLVAAQMAHLPPLTTAQIANWNDQFYQPVTVTDRRRTITNGITKIEFLHQDDAPTISKYVVFFADENGKTFSDIRTLPSAPLGTKKVIPFEIKTQSGTNPAKLFMLIRCIEDGRLVGKVEYKLNIAFTNDFDF